MEEINLHLHLTGSNFFDMVIFARARELEKKYPGLRVLREGETIIISGTLNADMADCFRREVE